MYIYHWEIKNKEVHDKLSSYLKLNMMIYVMSFDWGKRQKEVQFQTHKVQNAWFFPKIYPASSDLYFAKRIFLMFKVK